MSKGNILSFLLNGLTHKILRNQNNCNNGVIRNIKNIHDLKNKKMTINNINNNINKETWEKDSFKDILSIQETMQEPIKHLYPVKQR